jgi:hypothetical protein
MRGKERRGGGIEKESEKERGGEGEGERPGEWDGASAPEDHEARKGVRGK